MQAQERAHLPTAMGMQRRWAIKWMCQLRCFWTESMSCQIAMQRSQVHHNLTALLLPPPALCTLLRGLRVLLASSHLIAMIEEVKPSAQAMTQMR